MPAIFTYPPSGIAFTPYSISPRVNDQSLRPEPDEVLLHLEAEPRATR